MLTEEQGNFVGGAGSGTGKRKTMASNDRSVVQPFIIALSVFVMLTFVLAVTTYLSFKKADENLKLVEAKQKEASDANTKRLEAEKSRLELVKDVLGLPEDMNNEQILAEKQKAIDDVHGKHLEQPTYANALTWLSAAIEKHTEAMRAEQAQKDSHADEKQQAALQQAKELADLTASKKNVQDELDKLRAEKTNFETKSATEKNRLVDEKKLSDDKLKRVAILSDKIADAEKYLSSERRSRWRAEAAGGKAAVDDDRDERRVVIVLEEMRERERTIVRLNQIIAQLRVADPALQRTVLAATPKDDRVDGFDGRILAVNEFDRTVLVACGRTTGLRAGLKFNVYAPNDPRPQIDTKKAVVEVIAIESDSLVRCRVRQDTVRDPIIPGDVVATSLWSPGMELEVVVVGLPQFGGDSADDMTRFKQLVERIGGRVEETVTPSTTMLVDAGIPTDKGVDPEGQSGKRKMTAKEKEYRTRQLTDAKQIGIKVMAIEPFLDLMGLQLDSVRASRLPVPVEDRPTSVRSDNIAF